LLRLIPKCLLIAELLPIQHRICRLAVAVNDHVLQNELADLAGFTLLS
jgi:hypothetical protein